MTSAAITVTPASAVSDLPAVLQRGEAHFDAYVRASDGAFAAATRRAIASDTALFTGFCADLGVSPMPALPAVVVAFIDHCAGRGHKPATIGRRISSISHWHRAHGHRGEHDPTKAEIVRLRLRGVRRQLGAKQKQALGLTEVEVGQIIAAIGPEPGIKAVRDLAMLLVARDGLLRRSELVALDVTDLEPRPNGTARLTIRRSKTDQEGLGTTLLLHLRAAQWARRWLELAGHSEGPLLRTLTSKRHRLGDRLHPDDVSRVYKALARAAGIDPARISSHSTRVGMAQDLVAAGAGLPEIMTAGRWASAQMVSRYTRELECERGAIAGYYARRAAP